MDERLTIEEIERRYPAEWVVMTDIEADCDDKLRRARVYWHGPSRDEAWSKVDELPPPRYFAVWFMGPLVPDGMGIML